MLLAINRGTMRVLKTRSLSTSILREGRFMKQIQVIINPAAGKDIPVLSILNDEFRSKVDWDAQITHGPGDASRLGEKAIAKGWTWWLSTAVTAPSRK